MFFSLGLTAACGTLAGALSRRWAGAVAWSLFLRGLATTVPIGLYVLMPRIVPDVIYHSLNTVSLYSDSTIGMFALGDNGLSLTMYGPLEIGYEWSESNYTRPVSFRNSLPHLLFVVANPVVMSMLLILAFQWIAVRYMAWANRRG
jgi:hypothetical protein